MSKSLLHVINILFIFHSKEFILISQYVQPQPFYLSSTLMGNLESIPHLFCSFVARNTQELIKIGRGRDDCFCFQTMLHLFFLIFGPIILIFFVHHITINFMLVNKRTLFHSLLKTIIYSLNDYSHILFL